MVELAPLPPMEVQPRQQVYLGMNPTANYGRCWSTPEDSVGVVGPPRYGKTAGLFLPMLMHWDGPVVCTSTRGDLLRGTGDWRTRVAGQPGGGIYVYDPFGSEPGVTSMRWSPLAGCEAASVCYRRAAAMTAASSEGLSDSQHWRAGASAILRGMFHAAALGREPMSTVRKWLAQQDTREPAEMIRSHTDRTSAVGWADDLEAVQLVGERERGSFYSVARNSLEATAEPTVLESCSAVDLDIDRFLMTRSTLYIVGPSHYQDVVAPLIVGLVDSIAQRASELAAAQGGRLASPLLMLLDEVANIAPLPSLPTLVSEGGGRGIITVWSSQSLAALRDQYGADKQSAILTATTAKLFFGAMSNSDDLQNVSGWAGEARTPEITYYAGGATAEDAMYGPQPGGGLAGSQDTGRMHAVGSQWRPVLPVEAIQQLPPLRAWLFYRSDKPMLVETRPAGLMPAYQQLAGYTSPPGTPEAAEVPA